MSKGFSGPGWYKLRFPNLDTSWEQAIEYWVELDEEGGCFLLYNDKPVEGELERPASMPIFIVEVMKSHREFEEKLDDLLGDN